MIRVHRVAVAAICALPLVISPSAAAANETSTFTPTVDPIDGSSYSAVCDISDDGRWVVGSASAGTWGFGGLTVHDLLTSTSTVIDPDGPYNQVELSDDGQYITYARTTQFTFGHLAVHIYQHDRQSGQTSTVTSAPNSIYEFTTSDDGRYVLWSELADANNLYSARVYRIWDRNSGQRVDVTPTDDNIYPATPFSGSLTPQVVHDQDGDQADYVWHPLTGTVVHPTAPAGLHTAHIHSASADGTRLLYDTWVDAPAWHSRLVLADIAGNIIADTVIADEAEFSVNSYHLSEDASHVLIQGHRQLFAPSGITDGRVPIKVLWNTATNTLTELNLPGVQGQGELALSSPGICGLSSDLRWLVGKTSADVNPLVRIDTQTEAPTPVDPAVLDGPQLSDQIRRLYRAYFDRDPDAAGLSFWLNQRASGTPLINASNLFVESPEFRTTYGELDTQAFVTLVYDNVLERAPDASGLAHWTAAIDSGMSRGELMLAFSESVEFITRTGTSTPVEDPRLGQIERIYQAFLRRSADAEGLSFWNYELANGKTLDDIAVGFVNSTEFVSQYGELNNAQYVDLVYQNVLNRPPEATGRQFWIEQLAQGMQRGAVMTAFSESTEFIIATDTIPPLG